MEHTNSTLDDLKQISAGVINEAKFNQPQTTLAKFAEDFDPLITSLTNYLRELELFRAFTQEFAPLPLHFVEHYTADGSSIDVIRFGINTPHLKGQIGERLCGIFIETNKADALSISTQSTKNGVTSYPHLLHPLEVSLIKKAISYGKANKKKAILVDIFERGEDGNIQQESDSSPKVHTIVFYLQGDRLLLIDPSSSEFSRHITFNINRDILSEQGLLEILAPKIVTKIYSPPKSTETGPGHSQPRDCINIAALMTQYLMSITRSIDIDQLFSLDGIRQITNQDLPQADRAHNHLFFAEEDSPIIARIRQASDLGLRQEVHKYLTLLDKQLKCARQYSGTELDKIPSMAIGFFAQPYFPDQYSSAVSIFFCCE